MPESLWLLVFVIALALIFDFTNGWHDTANAIATVVGTRTLSPGKAIMMASLLNLAGAFFSTEVAKTIGSEIVNPAGVTLIVLVAALLSVIIWNVITVLMGLPTSSSHALLGSLIGAAVAYKGFGVLQIHGIIMILVALVLSPLIGGVFSFLFMRLVHLIFANATPSKIKKRFQPLQILSSAFMAFSHGASDAQKAMGIITMALVAGGYQEGNHVQTWVVVSAGLAMALGTAMGGRKVIHTIGSRLSRLETPQGFVAETSAAILLSTIAKIGIPVSTTHTITGSIIGVGAAERIRSVRWSIANKIIYAWIFTLPGTALMGCIFYYILHVFE